MQARKFSPWIWLALAIVLDVPVMVFHSGRIMIPLMRADQWSWSILSSSWTSQPIVLLVFFFTGFVAVVWAIAGTRLPLLFWNLCYLTVHTTLIFLYPLNRDMVNFAIIPGLVMATIALYRGDRDWQDGSVKCHP